MPVLFGPRPTPCLCAWEVKVTSCVLLLLLLAKRVYHSINQNLVERESGEGEGEWQDTCDLNTDQDSDQAATSVTVCTSL